MRSPEKTGCGGFSLIELMITVAVSTMIAYAIFAVMRSGESQIQNTQLKMTIQDSAREGLYKMVQEIRLSSSDRVTISNGGNTIQFDVPDPSAPVNADFSVNWDRAHRIQYALGGNNGTQVIRSDTTSGQTTVVANDVVQLDFDGDAANPNSVTVTIGVQRTTRDNRTVPANPLQMTAQADLRNPTSSA